MPQISKLCSFPGCYRPLHSRGLCSAHRQQLRKGIAMKPLYANARRPGECVVIPYIAELPKDPNIIGLCHAVCGRKQYGYRRIWTNGKLVFVHRIVWESEHGPIPAGLVIDHICRNRACCNVNHLRVVTKTVNALENVEGSAWQLGKGKTHCKNGHAFDEANTRYAQNRRYCRACARKAMRRFRRNQCPS